jgi:hypothetical protein
MRVWGRNELAWKNDALYLRGRRRRLIAIAPDGQWPGMWRVRYPDGGLSDMVNLSRAKDAAAAEALRILNAQETNLGGSRTAMAAMGATSA